MIFGVLFASVLLWFLALQIWNIPTLARSLPTARGLLRAVVGAMAAFLALGLLYEGLPDAVLDAFSGLSIVTFLAALAAEFLIGDEVRRLWLDRGLF